MTDMNDETVDFGAILDAFEAASGEDGNQRRLPEVGERVRGTILSIGSETAFVDLGGKSEGMLPSAELLDDDGDLTADPGDVIEATVTGIEGGTVLLRRKAVAGGPEAQAELQAAFAHQLPVEGTVKEVNKGGLDVDVGGLRAFCPISQIERGYVEDASAYIGQRLTFRITRYEESRGRPNIVLSRRALLEAEAEAKAEALRAKLEVGATLEGTVSSLAAYGAFIDLGGLEGLLHVSQIQHGRVDHPQDVLQIGQSVRVEVLKIETRADGKERISLSRKTLDGDPWDDAPGRFPIGTTVTGTVVRLAPFGAFVELAPGVDGLVHISHLGGGRRIQHPQEVLQIGQTVPVVIRDVDVERKRISLTPVDDEMLKDDDDDAPRTLRPRATGGGFGAIGDFLDKTRKPK
ncbi:MAG: S1 RNA-binding domain-containing protein [Acidobacteriota bacterium]